jgi:hypothetical protein
MINFHDKLGFVLSFLLPERCMAATYIFIAPTCTSSMITFKPCALNDEIQHFILRFNKIHYIPDTTERRAWGLKGCPKTRQRHDFQITLVSSISIGHYHTCYHSLNAVHS